MCVQNDYFGGKKKRETTATNVTSPSFSTSVLRKRSTPSTPTHTHTNVISQVTPVDRSNVCPTTIFNILVNGIRIVFVISLTASLLVLTLSRKTIHTLMTHSEYKPVNSSVQTCFRHFKETRAECTPLRIH